MCPYAGMLARTQQADFHSEQTIPTRRFHQETHYPKDRHKMAVRPRPGHTEWDTQKSSTP